MGGLAVALALLASPAWGQAPESGPQRLPPLADVQGGLVAPASPQPMVFDGPPPLAGPEVNEVPLMAHRLESAEARIRELEAANSFYLSSGSQAAQEPPKEPDYTVEYDDGFRITPSDEKKHPFELQINGRMQFRHVGFARDDRTWLDNAGVERPILDRNDFEIERGRLDFRGFFLDPAQQFFISLDSETDDEHFVIFHDFWINYEFSDAFNLHVGKAFVPGVRDWLNGSTRTRLVGRSMATSFFRPDRTLGVWAIGEPVENLFYRFMVGNGLFTTDLVPSDIDTQFVYSGSMWADLGDYGRGYADLEYHNELVMQVGQSFTAASMGPDPDGDPFEEMVFARLSDGTRLTDAGALAPGVRVNHYDIYLYTVDAAFKLLGFSGNAEYFFRWIQSLEGDGPLPRGSMYDHGYYCELGHFIVPHVLDVNTRVSHVYGPFGDGHEYGAGANWYINRTHNWKLSFDITLLENSPANASGENLRVGDDGLRTQVQFQASF